jgi:hypothetical protein
VSQLRRVPACLVASAALMICPLARAAPPEPAPVVVEPPPPSEPVLPAEPVPAEPVQAEPAPVVEPPPPSEPELPSWDAELPSYDEPLLPVEPAEPTREPVRLDGNGLTVVGAMLLGGGLVLGTSSGVLMAADSDELGLWIAGATLSGVAVATGIGLLAAGSKKRKEYKPWRLQHDAPPQGNGLYAGGVVSVSAAGFGVLLGTVSLSLQTDDDLPYGQVALSLAAVGAVTGIGLLIAGANRGKKFDAWHEAHIAPAFSLVPSPNSQLQTAGATFGVAGHF